MRRIARAPRSPSPAPATSARSAGRVGLAGVVGLAGAVGLAALAGLGCNEKALQTAGQVDAGAHHTSASLTPEQASKVLARVGDKTITLGDYVATLEHMDQFDRLRYQSPERRKELLTEMVNVELLAQEAEAKGYDKEPMAMQEIRAILRDAMLAEAHKGVPAPNDIPEEQVRAYYDAHRDDYRDPERRRVSVIVLGDEATAKQLLETAKKAANATEWGTLVRKSSIDPQAKANVPIDLAGDLGLVSPPGDPRGENPRVPAELRAVVFGLKDIADIAPQVVKADGKFYLVRYAAKTDAHERTLAEADRTIRVKLAQDQMHAKESELLQQLRAQFPVQVDDVALGRVHVDLADGGGAPAPLAPPADAGHD